jgi:hypothetical protein
VQGASIKFQLYKSIVASFNVTWCRIMSGLLDLVSPSSKNSDGAESGNATKKESSMNLDGTD